MQQIGKCLRAIRQARNLSQGDIEKRTGLLRCYLSRVENGHTIPSVATLERLAAALEIPLYQLFYDGGELPNLPVKSTSEATDGNAGGEPTGESEFLEKFLRVIPHIGKSDRRLLLGLARSMVRQAADRS